MKRKRLIVLIITLMIIGFASVSTTLILNGTIAIGETRFDVVFIEASTNGRIDNSIIKSDTSIEFTANLDTVGDEYVVDYVVQNESTNYAADIVMEYTGDESEYIRVTNDFDTATPLEAKKTRNGTVKVKLINPTTEDITINVSYKLSASPLERDILPAYEEEISYLSNVEEEIAEALNLLDSTIDSLHGIREINSDLQAEYVSYLNGHYEITGEIISEMNSQLQELNSISASADYNGVNLIDGSMNEPYKVELEETELYLPVYEINTTTLGLDGITELPIADAFAVTNNVEDELLIKLNELYSNYDILYSLKNTIKEKSQHCIELTLMKRL